MKEAKRKQIEDQLRRLIDAADRTPHTSEPDRAKRYGGIQVIRRRRAKPDRPAATIGHRATHAGASNRG